MNSRGLTLIELVIVLAMVALVASLALPSFTGHSQRTRLKAAAETLASDLAEARFEAAARGSSLFVAATASAPGDSGWCWAVATAPGCGCGQPQACQLKTVQAQDHPGIRFVQTAATRFDSAGQAQAAQWLLQSPRGEQLQVEVRTLGRALVCAPAAAVPGYPPCAPPLP